MTTSSLLLYGFSSMKQNQPADCVARGDAVLDYLQVSHSFGVCAGALLAYLAVLHAMTYAAFVVLTRRQQRNV